MNHDSPLSETLNVPSSGERFDLTEEELEKINELYAPYGQEHYNKELAKSFELYAPNGIEDYHTALKKATAMVVQSERMDALVEMMAYLPPEEFRLALNAFTFDLKEDELYDDLLPNDMTKRIVSNAMLPTTLTSVSNRWDANLSDIRVRRAIHEAEWHLKLKVTKARAEALHVAAVIEAGEKEPENITETGQRPT
jgi:hypothetical protein